jgi:hypothetical protein
MSEPEKFLDRWSRRKRQAEDQTAPAEPADAAKAPPPDSEANESAAESAFDPASLPPIESITAESDIRAFLKPGVPPDLARAALRRAWSADPAIRDFIGLVENGWDFNDPHGVPGFGPMPVGEDIGRLLAQVIGTPRPVESMAVQQSALPQGDSEQNQQRAVGSELAQQSPHDQPAPGPHVAAAEKNLVRRNAGDAASQNDSADRDDVPPSRRRGHGGALPK